MCCNQSIIVLLCLVKRTIVLLCLPKSTIVLMCLAKVLLYYCSQFFRKVFVRKRFCEIMSCELMCCNDSIIILFCKPKSTLIMMCLPKLISYCCSQMFKKKQMTITIDKRTFNRDPSRSLFKDQEVRITGICNWVICFLKNI